MITRYCFYLFFALIPFQIKTFLFGADLYVGGFFNTYTSVFLYLNEIVLLVAFVFLGIDLLRGKLDFNIKIDSKFLVLFMFFFFSIILSFFFSVDLFNSLIYLLRFFEFFLIYLILISNVLNLKIVFKIFISTMIFVSFIGIFQFLFQHSLGFSFLGEPLLDAKQLGVAKFDFFGQTYLRSYATFPHPNIFAGYLTFAIFMVLELHSKFFNKKMIWLVLSLFVFALFFTFSRSAILALILLLFFRSKFKWKYLFLLVLPVLIYFSFDLHELAISERIEYVFISLKMFADNIFGVGLGNFTNLANDYSVVKLEPWNLQPVHNIFLLILSELGVIGFFSFISIFVYLFKRSRLSYVSSLGFLFIVFVIGQFDHYFISVYQGQFLLFWAFSFATLNRSCFR